MFLFQGFYENIYYQKGSTGTKSSRTTGSKDYLKRLSHQDFKVKKYIYFSFHNKITAPFAKE
jgi:hypothetical protein